MNGGASDFVCKQEAEMLNPWAAEKGDDVENGGRGIFGLVVKCPSFDFH